MPIIRRNIPKSGIEVVFEDGYIIPAQIKQDLVKHRFKWSRFNGLYYKKYTPEGWTAIHEYFNLPTITPVAVESVKTDQSTDNPTSMKASTKKDILFLIGLQRAKQNKERTQWDINLFKSSFLNRVKRMGQSEADEALEYLLTTSDKMGVERVFTKKHKIWDFHSQGKDIYDKINMDNNSNVSDLEAEKPAEYVIMSAGGDVMGREIRDPELVRLKEKYLSTTDSFDKNRLLDNFIYSYAGPKYASSRQIFFEKLTGNKPPKAQAGIHALKAEILKWLKTFNQSSPSTPEATVKQEAKDEKKATIEESLEEKENRIYEFEKKRWTERYQLNKEKTLDDMRKYLASKGMGRNFNEEVDDFYKRTGFTKASEWMREFIKNPIIADQKTAKPEPGFFRETAIYTPPAHRMAEIEMDKTQKFFGKTTETWDAHLKTVGQVRPEFMTKPMLKGREIQISMPNGEKRNAQFAIVELDDIIASHNEENFHSSALYPKNSAGNNINDRNYKDDTSAQKAVMDYARELEPERLITTSRTPSGTPIITKDGFVVSGNNRTMSLKLAAKSYPENYKGYIKFLTEEIDAYGIANEGYSDRILKYSVTKDERDIKSNSFDHPVLVRIDYDFKEYTTQELAKYNKDTKKAERPIDKAIKLSNILIENPRCSDIIADTVGDYDTFSEFYANLPAQKRLAKNLLECNLLTEQEMPAYFSDTTFTETGKEFTENLLASLVLDREALLASEQPGVKSIRGKLITSLPVLMKNASLPEGSLKKHFNDAVIFQQKMVASGLSFADFIRQRNLFGEKHDRKTVYINRLIDSGKIKFKQAIEGYNTAIVRNQGATMFGNKPTVDEIFNHWIIGGVTEMDKKLIESSDVVSGKVFGTFAGQVPVESMEKAWKENTPIKEVFEKAGKEYPKEVPVVSEEITTPTQTDEELQDIDPNFDHEKGIKYLKVWKDQQGMIMAGISDKLILNQGEGSDSMKLLGVNNEGFPVGEIWLSHNLEINSYRGAFKEILQKVADRIRQLADNPNVQIVGMPKAAKSEPKFKIGDFVKYTTGDIEIQKWFGEIKDIVDLGKEYAYRIDAYSYDESDNVMFDPAKVNEKYEAELTLLVKPEFYNDYKMEYEKQQRKSQSMKSDIIDIFLPKIKIIKPFISQMQLDSLVNLYRSEEKQAAIDIATELAETISTMPATYETEDMETDDKIIHLHYFKGGSDWYIIEKDKGAKDDPVPGIQNQAFGYTVLNGDHEMAEWGYISIEDLRQNNVELDFYWRKKTFGEVKKKWMPEVKLKDYNKSQLRTQDGFNILLVDGEAVRKDYIQFTMGGNGYAYDWIPKDEIWIDENLFDKPADMEATIKHEIFEAVKMRDEGILYEFYTPDLVIQKMWGLAYKYGYDNGPVLEPSIGVGRFFNRKFVKDYIVKVGYEPNKYSAKICQVLYPEIQMNDGKESMLFEQVFIKNNWTVKGKVTPKYRLVIGNPPYGEAMGSYMAGMGEKAYTHARNFIDYFIFRGLDLLEPGGLLIYIIGAEVGAGGVPWLDQQNSKCKEAIAQKANLIDAYRLPEKVFDRTDVVSDIVVLRKK